MNQWIIFAIVAASLGGFGVWLCFVVDQIADYWQAEEGRWTLEDLSPDEERERFL